MKYIIPDNVVQGFISDIDRAIYFLKDIKETVDLQLKKASKLNLPKDKQFMNDVLVSFNTEFQEEKENSKHFNLLIANLEKLKQDLRHVNSKKIEDSLFFTLYGFLGVKEARSNVLVIKIIMDTLNSQLKNTLLKSNPSEFFSLASDLEKQMRLLCNGYEIKPGKEAEFKRCYYGYLCLCREIAETLVKATIKDEKLVGTYMAVIKACAYDNYGSMMYFVNNYPYNYVNEFWKDTKPKLEAKPSSSSVYTEKNELKYYIDGGKVIHLCAPRTLDLILKRNGYNDTARMNLTKQMKNAILMAEDGQFYSLVSDYLATLDDKDAKYGEMWNYLTTNKNLLENISFGDIRIYFFAIPEIGDGYGYTKEDYDYFLLDALESTYNAAKKQISGLNLVKKSENN